MIRIHNIKNAIINNLHILYDNNKLFDFCVDENIIKSYDKYLEHQRKDIEKCKLFNGNNGFGEILYNNMPIRNFDKEYREYSSKNFNLIYNHIDRIIDKLDSHENLVNLLNFGGVTDFYYDQREYTKILDFIIIGDDITRNLIKNYFINTLNYTYDDIKFIFPNTGTTLNFWVRNRFNTEKADNTINECDGLDSKNIQLDRYKELIHGKGGYNIVDIIRSDNKFIETHRTKLFGERDEYLTDDDDESNDSTLSGYGKNCVNRINDLYNEIKLLNEQLEYIKDIESLFDNIEITDNNKNKLIDLCSKYHGILPLNIMDNLKMCINVNEKP